MKFLKYFVLILPYFFFAQESKYIDWKNSNNEKSVFYVTVDGKILTEKESESVFFGEIRLKLFKNKQFETTSFLLCGTPPVIFQNYAGKWEIKENQLILNYQTLSVFKCEGYDNCGEMKKQAEKQLGKIEKIKLKET